MSGPLGVPKQHVCRGFPGVRCHLSGHCLQLEAQTTSEFCQFTCTLKSPALPGQCAVAYSRATVRDGSRTARPPGHSRTLILPEACLMPPVPTSPTVGGSGRCPAGRIHSGVGDQGAYMQQWQVGGPQTPQTRPVTLPASQGHCGPRHSPGGPDVLTCEESVAVPSPALHLVGHTQDGRPGERAAARWGRGRIRRPGRGRVLRAAGGGGRRGRRAQSSRGGDSRWVAASPAGSDRGPRGGETSVPGAGARRTDSGGFGAQAPAPRLPPRARMPGRAGRGGGGACRCRARWPPAPRPGQPSAPVPGPGAWSGRWKPRVSNSLSDPSPPEGFPTALPRAAPSPASETPPTPPPQTCPGPAPPGSPPVERPRGLHAPL